MRCAGITGTVRRSRQETESLVGSIQGQWWQARSGFYRIIGHSWLNVLMVGNITIAGLEQSKFIPAASGLIGFEFDRSFQLGVGVNLTPDPDGPSHMIAAAGWTPQVGAIQTPLHFFFVPDTEGNHRMGATIGMTW